MNHAEAAVHLSGQANAGDARITIHVWNAPAGAEGSDDEVVRGFGIDFDRAGELAAHQMITPEVAALVVFGGDNVRPRVGAIRRGGDMERTSRLHRYGNLEKVAYLSGLGLEARQGRITGKRFKTELVK